jgi:hypothetical protein
MPLLLKLGKPIYKFTPHHPANNSGYLSKCHGLNGVLAPVKTIASTVIAVV